jgi:8-oxo-dGTP diphosphatase
VSLSATTDFTFPERYLITGSDPTQRELFLARLGQALENGLQLIQLRAPKLSELELEELATAAQVLCRTAGAKLLVNGTPDMVRQVGCAGVHLNSRRLMELTERPLSEGFLVAASCHNRDELAHAEALGLDFVVLSPVLPTPSHPAATPLGWERFAALAAAVSLPVYALGGMRAEMLPAAKEHGAQGIAGISGLWPTT